MTLLQIFSHLHPYDLLRISRTTKEFRRILLHKSSISTWKSSFEEIRDLPPCPPEMCEPAWANLVFSPHCHVCCFIILFSVSFRVLPPPLQYCLAPGIRNVEWKFRTRVCSKCAPSVFVTLSSSRFTPHAHITCSISLVETGEYGGTISDLFSGRGGPKGLNLVFDEKLTELCLLVPNRGGSKNT